MLGQRRALLDGLPRDVRRRADAKGVHDGGVARPRAGACDAWSADEGVEKGGFPHVGRPQDDDFGNMLIVGVVAKLGGRVEELWVLLEKYGSIGKLGMLWWCEGCG